MGFLDKHQGEICVIAAGYECDMREYFLKVNEGLTRRFPAKYQLDLQRFCPVELWGIFKAGLLGKVKLENPDATINDLLTNNAQKVVRAIFYSGTGIEPYDQSPGFTFRHLLQNEASDAVEFATEMSILYFAGGGRALDAEKVGDRLAKWLKEREAKDITFDLPRDNNCRPTDKYPSVTEGLDGRRYDAITMWEKAPLPSGKTTLTPEQSPELGRTSPPDY